MMNPGADDPLEQLLAFLATLTARHISYSLAAYRADAIMVQAAVPGERWEVEFKTDGLVDVEVFRSDGTIEDSAALGRLLGFGQ